METNAEVSARKQLCQALVLVVAARDIFFSIGDTAGARLLKEVKLALEDEIAAIDKKGLH
jgi:hypothetical protein